MEDGQKNHAQDTAAAAAAEEGGGDAHNHATGTARPRRADTETLTYLRTLEPLIEKSVKALSFSSSTTHHQQQQQQEEETEEVLEDRALLVNNLINELTFKVASLAMDRHAAPVLEKLARLCSRRQLARLFEGCVGYAACLASNRYSSHVMQTFLSLAGGMIEKEVEGDVHEEEEDDEEEEEQENGDGEEKGPVLLHAAVAKVAEELQASWMDLMYDLCGTHSMRSLFCVLAGMPVVAEKRGKNAKHQHAIETAVVAGGGGGGGGGGGNNNNNTNAHTTKLHMYKVPDSFLTLLDGMVDQLAALDLMTLHQSLCDPYASPALCLLLQAIARRESENTPTNTHTHAHPTHLAPGGKFLTHVVYKALCWDRPERCGEVIYAMAGEALSSRFIEAVLWHTDPQVVATRVFSVCFEGKVLEFAEHEVGNFVLQTWMQVTTSSAQLKAALEELTPNLALLVGQKRRAGVIWRLAEACLRLHKHEKKMIKAILGGLGGGGGGGGGDKDKSTSNAATVVVQTLLNLQVNEADGGRLFLNVPGARLLECLMGFPSTSSKKGEKGGEEEEGAGGGGGVLFCKAILALPAESLVAIAKDNVGSRTLLDPILLQASTSSSSSTNEEEDTHTHTHTSKYSDRLTDKLKGHVAELALHPVGFHVLTKCFNAGLSLEGKRLMVEEMVVAESRLAGGHFGRRALGVLCVSLYRSNRGKWEEVMRKGEKKRAVLDELFGMLEEGGRKGEGGEEEEKGGGKEKKKEKKEKKEKRGGKGEDPIMAMLLGEGTSGEKKEKEKEKTASSKKKEKSKADGASGGGDGGDLGFVLDAIKKSGSKKDRKEKKKEEAAAAAAATAATTTTSTSTSTTRTKDKKKEKRDDGGERATTRERRASGSSSTTNSSSRKHKHDANADEDNLAPVEKAKRILGNRTMMSKSELFSAVEGLEREMKKQKK